FLQDRPESDDGLPVSRLDLVIGPERLHDQVDGTVVQMEPPAIGQHCRLSVCHTELPSVPGRCACASGGHGLLRDASTSRRGLRYSPPCSSTSGTLRMWSACPPSEM